MAVLLMIYRMQEVLEGRLERKTGRKKAVKLTAFLYSTLFGVLFNGKRKQFCSLVISHTLQHNIGGAFLGIG